MILNEKKEAERLLRNLNSSECNLSTMISLLIRYCIQIENMNNKEAVEKVNKYIKTYYKGYNPKEWEGFIDKILITSSKRPLRELEKISITQNEIDKIKEFQGKTLQKVAFTYLVVAKFNYYCSGLTWVNASSDELFVIANAKSTEKRRCSILNALYNENFIECAKILQNTNMRVNEIDTIGEEVFAVKSISNLGLFWEMICGKPYRICEDCGTVFKPVTNNQKYCSKHSGKIKTLPCVYTCIDCGRDFEIKSGTRAKKRCECCQREYIKNYDRNRKKCNFP